MDNGHAAGGPARWESRGALGIPGRGCWLSSSAVAPTLDPVGAARGVAWVRTSRRRCLFRSETHSVHQVIVNLDGRPLCAAWPDCSFQLGQPHALQARNMTGPGRRLDRRGPALRDARGAHGPAPVSAAPPALCFGFFRCPWGLRPCRARDCPTQITEFGGQYVATFAGADRPRACGSGFRILPVVPQPAYSPQPDVSRNVP